MKVKGWVNRTEAGRLRDIFPYLTAAALVTQAELSPWAMSPNSIC